MAKKRKRQWRIAEGILVFPCPYCKGKGGEYEYLDGASYKVFDCGGCEGDGVIETGSKKHRRLFIFGIHGEIVDRLCRTWDDYYATDAYEAAWRANEAQLDGALNALFDLYVKRYGGEAERAESALHSK